MSNVCEICGKKKAYGARIIRRGLAKKKGGIGMHVVKVSPRVFEPNIQTVKVNPLLPSSSSMNSAISFCLKSPR